MRMPIHCNIIALLRAGVPRILPPRKLALRTLPPPHSCMLIFSFAQAGHRGPCLRQLHIFAFLWCNCCRSFSSTNYGLKSLWFERPERCLLCVCWCTATNEWRRNGDAQKVVGKKVVCSDHYHSWGRRPYDPVLHDPLSRWLWTDVTPLQGQISATIPAEQSIAACTQYQYKWAWYLR